MIKRIFFFFLPLFLTQFCSAQSSEEYVEVIVQDTLSIEADEMTFSIHILPYELPEEYLPGKASKGAGGKPALSTEEKVRQLIRRMGLDTIAQARTTINTTELKYGVNVFMLRFTAKDKLFAFADSLRKIRNISAAVIYGTSTRLEEAQRELINNLLKKAEIAAKNISVPAGKILGTVFQVKELESDEPAGEFSSLLMTTPGTYIQSPTGGETIHLSKKFLVRFAWK